jgi:hypothetical protein
MFVHIFVLRPQNCGNFLRFQFIDFNFSKNLRSGDQALCQDPPRTSIDLAPELVQERPQIGDLFLNDPSPFL